MPSARHKLPRALPARTPAARALPRAHPAKSRLSARRDAWSDAADLFSFAPVIQVLLDGSGLVLDVSASAAVMLGTRRAAMLGVPLRQFVVADDRGLFADHLRRAHWHGALVDTDVRLQAKDGGRVPARLYTLRTVRDGIVVFPTVAVDLTEQLVLEQARQLAERDRDLAERDRAVARESEAGKDRLLAMVSHELRNPLSPALLAAQTLMEQPDRPSEVRRLAEVVKRNIELEARLIDDLLDVARITRGRLELASEPVSVHAVLEEAIGACERSAGRRRVRVRTELVASSDVVLGEASRLRQVFWNLVDNAIKFSEPGGEVLVRTIDDASSIRIAVRDHGAGIERDSIESLFHRFTERLPQSGGRSGLGLGLTIAKGIVDAHFGHMSVSSAGAGLGSTFEVCLERLETQPARPSGVPAAPARSAGAPVTARRILRVLIVEDHSDTADMLAARLCAHRHDVTVARTTAEGVERLGEPWDVIVSDIALGDGSGLDIARQARAGANPPAKLIALTGFGAGQDVAASREAGFDAHLVKPVDVNRLLDLIDSA